jgi:hypothetical protein
MTESLFLKPMTNNKLILGEMKFRIISKPPKDINSENQQLKEISNPGNLTIRLRKNS